MQDMKQLSGAVQSLQPHMNREGRVVLVQHLSNHPLCVSDAPLDDVPTPHIAIQPSNTPTEWTMEPVDDDGVYLCTQDQYVTLARGKNATSGMQLATLTPNRQDAVRFHMHVDDTQLVRFITHKNLHLTCLSISPNIVLGARAILPESQGLFTVNK
jgi:hypothetical protein